MVKKRKGFPEKPEKITSFGQRSKKGRPASDPRFRLIGTHQGIRAASLLLNSFLFDFGDFP
jgi:hypothetical protein